MREPTTKDLINELGDDITKSHEEIVRMLNKAPRRKDGGKYVDHGYHARQLIRAIFAFIEAVTFSMKIWAVVYCLRHKRDVSDGERFLAAEVGHNLNEKGDVVERPAHIRLTDNIRFAFALQEKALLVGKQFDPASDWWAKLKSSIKVRDRLTHPKLPGDIDVSPQEIIHALEAYEGFKTMALKYISLRRSALRQKKKQIVRRRVTTQ